MKKVDQTTFGEGIGNCFSACVASILELDINEVPLFGLMEDEIWWKEFKNWLKSKNLEPLYCEGLNFRNKTYSIVTGKSTRGDFLHSVVYFEDKMIHDPHFSRLGIENILDTIIII